ncbi:MAG TPA: gliding motility-associated C-terminal domain-containing protein, partial [Bacteroidia bacterium]|nr:gliding motility-associated C-terminal domain-containing protein [Bacteroidia bacterium]
NTGTSGAGVTYSWDFGTNSSPPTSIAEDPSGITYSTPGTKLITFTVASGSCIAVDTMSIVSDTVPVASFTSNAPKCTGDSVTFTNTGSATNVTYNWNFGPNGLPATSTNQNVSGVAFSTSGMQTISLTVTNLTSGCSATTTQTININQTPTATFITNAPQCAGSSVNFTNTGTTGAGITYSWDFGLNANPQTSSMESPMNIVYSSGGKKLITFTVTNGACSMVDTMTIAIDSLPVASAGNDTTICASDSVQIGVAAVAGYTYSWAPAYLVTNAGISNPYAKPTSSVTNYILTVTSPSGCINHDTVVVSLFAPLVANVGPPVTICRLDSVQLGASPIAGQKYSWNPRKGLSDSAIANPKASPDSTTIYTLTVTDNGCTPGVSNVTVTVHQLPWNPTVIDTIAMGSSIQLTVTGGVEYIWTPSSGLSNPGANDPIASPDTTTKYTVLITDLYGCFATDTVNVNVIGLNYWAPTAFTPNGDGKDDIFYIHGEIKNFDFGIYNRWGEEIYHSQNINEGWNGRRQVTGEEAPDGAYIYYVKGTLANGQGISSKGMVNLIR